MNDRDRRQVERQRLLGFYIKRPFLSDYISNQVLYVLYYFSLCYADNAATTRNHEDVTLSKGTKMAFFFFKKATKYFFLE